MCECMGVWVYVPYTRNPHFNKFSIAPSFDILGFVLRKILTPRGQNFVRVHPFSEKNAKFVNILQTKVVHW
jgi:hypothetical protein